MLMEQQGQPYQGVYNMAMQNLAFQRPADQLTLAIPLEYLLSDNRMSRMDPEWLAMMQAKGGPYYDLSNIGLQ